MSIPKIVLHTDFISIFNSINFVSSFPIISTDDLKKNYNKCVYVSDGISHPNFCQRSNAILLPSEYDRNRFGDGEQPQDTSYVLTKNTKFYNIKDTVPRYVIWPKYKILTVNCTILHRIENELEFLNALKKAETWCRNISEETSLTVNDDDDLKSVIVYDLDETLFTSRDELIPGSLKNLQISRNLFDIVILWSHGSSEHVERLLDILNKELKNFKFDLILKNENGHSPKNLLSLYRYFPNVRFHPQKCYLIDDSLENYTPEYSNVIVPVNLKSTNDIFPTLVYLMKER
ncbi:unknown [Gryllus bimaculatus nudivirus]|uniref:Uncharacterized protein n=1 Tax=Gryllus bimaculatus nudivirus TaxID=432587 RepID=A4L1W4_9VIRU|nr:hypothetical protein GrBNV_gp01 [Gryllus bimaculatus nudivirus]ABO45334.1 unknown [Gryllus bimaculatus nudivirus]